MDELPYDVFDPRSQLGEQQPRPTREGTPELEGLEDILQDSFREFLETFSELAKKIERTLPSPSMPVPGKTGQPSPDTFPFHLPPAGASSTPASGPVAALDALIKTPLGQITEELKMVNDQLASMTSVMEGELQMVNDQLASMMNGGGKPTSQPPQTGLQGGVSTALQPPAQPSQKPQTATEATWLDELFAPLAGRMRAASQKAGLSPEVLQSVGQGTQQAGQLLNVAGLSTAGSKASSAGQLLMTGARAAEGDPTAMAEMAEEVMRRLQAAGGHMMSALGRPMAALQKERVGELAGTGFESTQDVGKAMSDIGLPGGQILEATGRFGKELTGSIDKLRDFSKQLHESNMRFAEFSAGMARVEADADLRQMQLSRERGDRRAREAGYLAEGRSQLEQTLAPAEDAWARFKDIWAGTLDKLLAQFLERSGLTAFPRLANAILDWIPLGPDPGKGALQKDLEEAGKEFLPRPPRFGGR